MSTDSSQNWHTYCLDISDVPTKKLQWSGNLTYVSMTTNIPIIKHREFLHISMCYISVINEHIASKFTPVMQGNTRWMFKNHFRLCAECSWRNTDRECCFRYHECRTVFASRDVKHFFFCNVFFKASMLYYINLKVKHQG